MSEFDIIREIFEPVGAVHRSDTILGIGDDAAVLAPPHDADLVMAMDVSNEGVHFPVATSAHAVGHKALAVNLSDLAAMAAKPLWFTLGLSLPHFDRRWLESFAEGLGELARKHDITLVGGDTTRGPLSVAVNVCGAVEKGQALTRRGACPGDVICVTGSLGEPGLALDAINRPAGYSPAEIEILNHALNYPQPRIAAGRALRGLATAAIDISDGLAQDLGHIAAASGVSAVVRVHDIPLGPVYTSRLTEFGFDTAATFGDDYELLVTVPEAKIDKAIAATGAVDVTLTPVGTINDDAKADDSSVTFVDAQSKELTLGGGFDHFRTPK